MSKAKQRAKVRFKLLDTLAKLKEVEGAKPPGERAIVPSPFQIAQALGKSTKGLLNMQRGTLLNLRTVEAILDLLRAQGLEVELADLLTEEPQPVGTLGPFPEPYEWA